MGTFKLLCRDVIEALKPLPPNLFHGVLCDPPYGLKFMGKKWDHGVPGPEYWSEVLRILKPGAPILAFGGTRTFHRLACAIEDAGFEIFDSILGAAWIYGQGFPKGLRVDESVHRYLGEGAFCRCAESTHNTENTSQKPTPRAHTDTAADAPDGVLPLSNALRLIDRGQGSPGGCLPDHGSRDGQPLRISTNDLTSSPSRECAQAHSHSVSLSDDADSERAHNLSQAQCSDPHASTGSVSHSAKDAAHGLPSHKQASSRRADVSGSGRRSGGRDRSSSRKYSMALPRCLTCGLPKADVWAGYNVCLKPAWEPIVFARKPLSGTYAENCIEHGTGGLNIDGSRIGTDPSGWGGKAAGGACGLAKDGVPTNSVGRYPANLILSHHPECEDAGGCHPECPVAALDRQSGERRSPTPYVRKSGSNKQGVYSPIRSRDGEINQSYGDSGGASRFFASFDFRYAPKVSTAERNAGGVTNRHSTLKPLALTTYLAKLILPPPHIPSRLLVPFCGTGSEIAGALIAGWGHVVGIDNDPESISTAQDRIPGLITRGTK